MVLVNGRHALRPHAMQRARTAGLLRLCRTGATPATRRTLPGRHHAGAGAGAAATMTTTTTTSGGTAVGPVPDIDVGPFFHGTSEDKAQVVAEIAKACEEIGFFSVRNHGVPQPVIDQAWVRSALGRRLPACCLPTCLSISHSGASVTWGTFSGLDA
jgi:hypothetical protein